MERASARAAKDWARADEIRDQLTQMRVVIEDGLMARRGDEQ